MLERFLRPFRGTAPNPVPEPSVSRMRMDSLRRSAELEATVSSRPVPPPPAAAPQSQSQPQSRSPAQPVAFTPVRAPAPAQAPTMGAKDKLQADLARVCGVESPALRGYFATRMEVGDEDPDFNARRTAAFDAAFAGDPLALTIDLYARSPARRSLPNAPGELRRLNAAFDDALREGWKRALAAHEHKLRFTDDQLATAMRSAGVLIGSGAHDRFEHSYGPIVEAATQAWPQHRDGLIAMFMAGFSGRPYEHLTVMELTEKLMEQTPLAREEVPALVAYDREAARRDAARASVFAELGELLAPAMEVVLDRYSGFIDSRSIPELRALREPSPERRGELFALLARTLPGLGRHGIDHWGKLKRSRGRYRIGLPCEPDYSVQSEMSFLFRELTSRKIVLPDRDATIAAFLDILPRLIYLQDRKLLELVLDTARQAPRGATAAKLRTLITTPMEAHPFSGFRLDIDDALRNLPEGGADTGKGPAAPGEAVIHLGDVGLREELHRQFGHVLDPRLHTALYRDRLDRLTRVHDGIRAYRDRGIAMTFEGLAALAQAEGFEMQRGSLPFMDVPMAERSAELGALVRLRVETFTPFVTDFPEQARALARLIDTLGASGTPSAKWRTQGRAAIAGIAPELHLAMIEELLEKRGKGAVDITGDTTLRALLYLAADSDPALMAPRLTGLALKQGYAKVRGQGMTCEKLGNACVWTLGAMPGGAGIPFLARIQARVNYPKVKALIDARLDEAAKAAGMSRSELDEVMVPAHGLDADGMLRAPLGDGEAVLRVAGKSVEIDWLAGGKRRLKAPSAAMKEDKAALKAVRDLARAIEADLSVQRARIQRLYLDDRGWAAEDWRARYLDHPLTGALARRLIWWIEQPGAAPVSAMATPDGKGLVTLGGTPVDAAGARIRLWHPIAADPAEVEAWRDELDRRALVQPFAQAWREIYVLTDAERATGTYSNRWAAHILGQHQAMELARSNGWRVTHRVGYDVQGGEPWHLMLAAHGLVADYWVAGSGGEYAATTPGGAFAYIATDRVQFHAIDADARDSARGPERGRAVPLTEIPAVVFSEVMRQADLFTSVASIGNDPTWLDQGGDAAHPDRWRDEANGYWNRVNSAELEQAGKRRRAILERTVPRLRIAGKLSFDDRHLIVEGTRNRYRIHLGSGGAFVGRRHICIVVDSAAPEAGRIWLPFEGDRTLSIILSKAILLAADDKITDRVILGQIGG